MYQYHVGLRFLEHVAHAGEHAGCDIVEVLSLFHYVEVIIGGDFKELEYLVEHLAVLACYAHYGLECFGVLLELLH